MCEEKKISWKNIILGVMYWKMVEGCQMHYLFIFVLTFKKVRKIIPY